MGTGFVRGTRSALVLATALLAGACDDSVGPVNQGRLEVCDLPQDLLWASLPPDAIPALTLPDMVGAEDDDAAYLFDFDRVLGVVINGEARAYPHNILWHHEIVNDQIGDQWISVSFCPLTGSGVVFDPQVDGVRLDLGVSGLLFANNLVMFDRTSGAVYGPQLEVDGRCSVYTSATLEVLGVQEMSWGRWKALYPDTRVVGGSTGFPRNYRNYPYGSYDEITSSDLLFPMDVDDSRPLKERVLAIRNGRAGQGWPFGELAGLGDQVALNETVGGVPTAIFYEARDGETATAFDARADGQTLTFDTAAEGTWMDRETSSTWSISGLAIDGPLAGSQLEAREDAYVLFWFAWRHFQPDGETFGS